MADKDNNDQFLDDIMADVNAGPEDEMTLDDLANEVVDENVIELQAEIAELKNSYMRALADVENSRKRADRDRREAENYGGSRLARDLLPVYDNMSRALQMAKEDGKEGDKALLEGVELTMRALIGVFKKHGIDPADLKSDKVPFLSLVLPNGETYGEKGKIVFIDNKVDSQTGTITIRGQFDNADHRLMPGVFVSTFIEAPVETKALLTPQAAVQRDQRGSFVLIVNSEQSVEKTYVELGAQNGPDFIVTKGLKEGDRVITEGLQKVRAGIKVNPVPASKPVE